MRRVSLLGTLLSLVLAAPAAAGTINVAADGLDSTCSEGGSPCKTLVKAESIASDGDVIAVAAGVYLEPATVEVDVPNLTFRGAGTGTIVSLSPAADLTGPVLSFTEAGSDLADMMVFKNGGSGSAVATTASLDLDRAFVWNLSGSGLAVTSPGSGSGTPIAVTADSSVFSASADQHGITAVSQAGALVGSTADDVTIDLRHVTIAGAANAKGISLDSTAANPCVVVCLPGTEAVGNLAAKVKDSIVDGPSTTAQLASSGSAVGNSSTITFEGANLADPVNGGAATGGGVDAAALFWGAPQGVVLLRQTAAAAIDKGSADPAAGEPDKDVYGEPRKLGAATDLGADEWQNLAPSVGFDVSKERPNPGEEVTFTSTARDPEDGFGGGIVKYYWDFGDGKTEITTSPTVKHTYATEGDKDARLAVEDNLGAFSAIATKRLVVDPIPDLAAPVVEILQPKEGQKLKLRGPKPKKKGRKRKALQLTILGGVTDATGIKQVDVSLRLVDRRKGKSPAAGTCEFYDGKRRFTKADCDQPVWLKVSRTKNVWRFRSRKGYRLPRGLYELRARGTDIVGNVSHAVDIEKTEVGFRVK